MRVSKSSPGRRHGVLVVVAAVSAILPLAACGGSSGAETSGGLTTVKTTTMTVTGGYWREMVAKDKGFFKDEGLNVEQTSVSPQVSVDALLSNSANIGLGDPTKLVQAVDKGANIVMIGQGVDRSGSSLIAKKSIKSIADLKGARIGLANQVDPYNAIVDQMLKAGGVSPSDVDFVYGQGSSDRAGALQGGAIDATLLPPPTDAAVVAKGFNVLGKTTDIAPLLSRSSIIANKGWAEKHPGAVKSYLKAIHRAAEWLYDKANEDEAIAIISKETKSDQASSKQAYEEYVVGKQWDVDKCINVDAMQELLDRLADLKVVKATSPSKYLTTKYCA